ncbi:MAG: LysR family transcriptional regulator [Proteobacteria bacterium]|nr:LysR family transcriptional regulator [Pseudomonadota bacterium]
MDRLDELAIFVGIVEEGSLIRAARRLRRSPPAVTRALASLEDRAGSRLIDRTTRRLAPTDAGRALLERARLLLGEYDAAMQGSRDAPIRGVLRVTAPVLFGRRHVAPVVAAFLDAFEEVEVELVLADRNVDLIDEAIDVAIRIGPLADSSLLMRSIGEVRRLWVASPAYLKTHGTPQRPEDLARHVAVLGTSAAAQNWNFGRGRRPRRPRSRLRVDDVETRLQAARAGRGIAHLLSYQVADDLAAGRLVRLLREHEGTPLPVSLLTKGADHRAPRVEAFVDFAFQRLSRLSVVQPERRSAGKAAAP